MMFFDCPAWLDKDGAVRCGLPAEVRCRLTMRSTSGFLESTTIRCPDGHWFSGPIESLTWDAGTHTIRALPESLPAPSVTASTVFTMALTAGAGTFHPGIARGSQTRRPASRTALRPTT